MVRTTDDNSYYRRVGTKKAKAIQDYIRSLEGVKKVYDVGCNNGTISNPLRDKHDVCGIDLSKSVTLPEGYNFRRTNVVTDKQIVLNDCTIFLSLYHHILGNDGLPIADDVFLRLLLRTKHLVFDSGNCSERSRSRTHWYTEQAKSFRDETALLQHFNLPYRKLCTWNCGGGSRSVVSFETSDWDSSVKVLGEYRRKRGTKQQKSGLVSADTKGAYDGCLYRKLGWCGKELFAKKRVKKFAKKETTELLNIVSVYGTEDPNKLPKFYGVSEKYGLVFEWLDEFKYLRKSRLKGLVDVDEIRVGKKTMYIDFER